jgi:hypothetical protein
MMAGRRALQRPRRHGIAGGQALLACLACVLLAALANAQTRKGPAPAKRTAPALSVDAGSSQSAVMAAAAPSDAGGVEVRTLDGGTRVFKFKELDIEGRLKSPQLVYFLRRVRAEFAAETLGHRTFLREMSETRKESSF